MEFHHERGLNKKTPKPKLSYNQASPCILHAIDMLDESFEALKNEGNAFFAEKDYISALTKYTEAICSNRSNPILYSNRAATFLKLDSWNNAIEDCNKGLQLLDSNTKSSVKVKLLWRKTIGLRNIKRFDEALETVQAAMKINPDSSYLINELKLIEKECPSCKKEQTEKSHQNPIINDSGMLDIEIKEVDVIPPEFYHQTKPSKEIVEQITTPIIKDIDLSKPKLSTRYQSNQKSLDISKDSFDFPLHPSLQFLLSIKEKPVDMKNSYLEYLFMVPVESYKNIFKTTGIDPEVLNMFLDACVFLLESDKVQYKSAILQRLQLFIELPRFTLTSMFVDSEITKKLAELFTNKLDENFYNYWK